MATKFSPHSLLIIAILGISACCTGCNSDNSIDTLPAFSVISDDEFGMGNKNREVAIRLEVAATETELTAIANEIRKKKSKSYEKTNVHFYLPGMEPGSGAWATANFNPNIEVRILGSQTE